MKVEAIVNENVKKVNSTIKIAKVWCDNKHEANNVAKSLKDRFRKASFLLWCARRVIEENYIDSAITVEFKTKSSHYVIKKLFTASNKVPR
jgi:hypothetical protein